MASIIRADSWDKSANRDVFKTLVKEWFNSTDRLPLIEFPNVVKEIRSGDEYERFGRFAGLDYPGALDEGEAIPVQDAKFGSVKDYTQVAYGTGFRITDRMKRFEKIGLFEFLTKNLRNMMLEGKDVEIAKMFNNMTSTTYASGFDGFQIAYDSHTTLETGTTYDNYLDAALSTSSLESALNYFDYMYDDRGNIFVATPDTLVVNRTLRWDSIELLKSPGKPWEMSNTISPYKGELTPFVYHRLTSTTAWFVIAKNDPRYDYFVITTVDPDARTFSVDSTRDTIVDSLQYFTYGVGDSRMLFCGDT